MPASLEVARRLMKPASATPSAPARTPAIPDPGAASFDSCLQYAANGRTSASPDPEKSGAPKAPSPNASPMASRGPKRDGQPHGKASPPDAVAPEAAPPEEAPVPVVAAASATDAAPSAEESDAAADVASEAAELIAAPSVDTVQVPPNILTSLQLFRDDSEAAPEAAATPEASALPAPAAAVDRVRGKLAQAPAQDGTSEEESGLPEATAPRAQPTRPREKGSDQAQGRSSVEGIPASPTAYEHASPRSALNRTSTDEAMPPAPPESSAPARPAGLSLDAPRSSSQPTTPASRTESTDSREAAVAPPTQASAFSAQPAAPSALAAAPGAAAGAPETRAEAPRSPGNATMPAFVSAPAHVSADSAQSAATAQEPPRVAPDHTFDQIVLGLRTRMDATHQKAQIELNPPNLGRLQVSVEVSNGALTAQFNASTDVVRDLLSSRVDRLRSVLEGQGITVDKIAVTTAPETAPAAPTAGSSGSNARGGSDAGLANDSHDGRSGGAFAQDRQAPRQTAGDTFASLWRAAQKKTQPIDLLA